MKYHISDTGKIVECHAQQHVCPKQNFDSIEKAEKFLQTLSTPHRLSKTSTLQNAERFYGGKFVSPYEIHIPENIEKVIDVISKIGNPLIVGGAVRDSFVNAENKDIDIEVYGTTIDNLMQHLKKQGYTVDEVGKQFGVLKISKKNSVRDLDVAVPRKENRTGAGHRSFEVDLSPEMTVSEAAERRDFTFNAVMYDSRRKLLIDPVHGEKDFENRIMKHISDKFSEDPLRVLRGFQFAARFGMSYDPNTAELCRKLRPEYDSLPTERIQEEWGKFFTKSTNPRQGIIALQESGWDDTIKGLKESLMKPETVSSLQNLVSVNKSQRTIMGASIIAQGMSQKDRKDFLSSTVIGKDQQEVCYDLASFDVRKASTTKDRRNLAFKMARRGFTFRNLSTFSQLSGNKRMLQVALSAKEDGVWNGPEPDLITGKDVLSFSDKAPGPWVGKLISEMRERQYSGEFRKKSEGLSIISELLKNNSL